MSSKTRYERKECIIEGSPHKGEKCITLEIKSLYVGDSQYPVDEKVARGQCSYSLECNNSVALKAKCTIIKNLKINQ